MRRTAAGLSWLSWLHVLAGSISLLSGGVSSADELVLAQTDTEQLAKMDLNELLNIVVTATKTEQTIEDAPAIVQVIHARDIERFGYRSVGEALQRTPGLAAIYDLVFWNIGIRGVFSEPGGPSAHLKVMINGQPVAFKPTSVNFLGQELIPIEAVERIEFVRSPASALYGANALLGVINIITKKYDKHHAGNVIVYAEGAYYQNEYIQKMSGELSLLGAHAVGPVSFLLAGTIVSLDRSGLVLPGFDDITQEDLHARTPENFPPARGYPTPGFSSQSRRTYADDPVSRGDLDRSGSAYGEVVWDLGSLGKLTADGSFEHLDRFGEFQYFSILSHKNRIALNNSFLRLGYQFVSKGGSSARASVAYVKGEPDTRESIVDSFTPNIYKKREFSSRAWDLALEGTLMLFRDLTLTVGADYSYDDEDLQAIREVNFSSGESSRGNDPGEKTFQNLGGYLHGMWKRGWIGVTAGARVDYNDVVACDIRSWDCFGKTSRNAAGNVDGTQISAAGGEVVLSSRLAFLFHAPKLNLNSKLIYGSSYKPPSPYQMYHEPLSVVGSSVGEPTLRPQIAQTIEALLDYKPTPHLGLSLVGYYTQVRDMVFPFKIESTARAMNADLEVSGLELTADWRWASLSLYANLSVLLYSEVQPQKPPTQTDFEWAYSHLNTSFPVGMYPELLYNLGVSTLFADDRLCIGAEIHFVGRRRSSIDNTTLYDPRDLNHAYTLAPYVDARFILSTHGLKLFWNRETRFSLMVRGAPGAYINPGNGGVDVPGLGPQMVLSVTQML